jgi:hypothetical protein
MLGIIVLNAACGQTLTKIRISNPSGTTPQEKCAVQPDATVTADAAMCIARVSGLQSGLSKWQVREYADYVDVFNTTARQPIERGTNVRIRRVGGAVLAVEPWEAVVVR